VSVLLGEEEVRRELDECLFHMYQTFMCWDTALHFRSAVLDYKEERSEENQRPGVVGVLKEDSLCLSPGQKNTTATTHASSLTVLIMVARPRGLVLEVREYFRRGRPPL
jgi:hypothetical protein